MNIAIIGGGNLGQSIALGLIEAEAHKPKDIWVTRRYIENLDGIAEKGINVSSDNLLAVQKADIVILCVKPKRAEKVLTELKQSLDPEKHVLVSVVTGLSIEQMREVVGAELPVLRAMPNTAIAIRESMTFVSSDRASAHKKAEILAIFNKLGDAIVIEEDLMQAGTVLGACGIAYALRFIRAAQQGGIQIGFDAETAGRIAAQTVKGAACLLIERGLHPEREIDKVTTPMGVTIEGLNEMEHRGFSSALIKGITASFNKI